MLYQGFFEQNNWPVNTVVLFLQRLPKDIKTTQISNFLHFVYENEISYILINELLHKPFKEGSKIILNNWQTILAKHVLELYLQNKSYLIGSKDRVKCEVMQLLQVGWSINNIKRLIDIIIDKSNDNIDNSQTLLNAIQIICYYNITADFNSKDKSNIFNVIEDNNIENIDFILRNFAIEQKFQLTSEKSIEVLLNEIAEKNIGDLHIQRLINNNVLKYEYQSIERKYNSCSTLLINDRAIKFWYEEDIQHWSNLIKGSTARLPEYQSEILAVIKRAIILDSKYEPRVIQTLAVLLMLYTGKETGRLIQVATGEGKSMIVAMLAVIKALREEVVDIVTSSSILAKRDATEKTKFYSMFNLTVQDIIGNHKYINNLSNQIKSTLRQEENKFLEISTTIIKAITQQYHSGISTCITAAEKIAAINEILNIIKDFTRKLYSILPKINSQLPDTKEIFKTYMQHDLSSDESDRIYNLLVSEEIINEQGKVKQVNKILNLNLGEENEEVKIKILEFCKKVQATDSINTQAIRKKIATNIEHTITNRIINLVKGKILNPVVESGISSISNDMMSKLNQASSVSKAKIKQELQKNYSQVVLMKEVDEEKDNAQLLLAAAYEESMVNKKEGFTPPKDIPPIKDTEGYLYLDASAQQLARPIYVFRNGELDQVAGMHYKYSPPFSIDYVDGQGWKKHKSFQQPTSLLKVIKKESGLDLTETFYNIASDPKVKMLRVYDLYEHSCLQIHRTPSGHVSYLSPLYPPTATQHLEENSSREIDAPTTSSVQVKLSSIGNAEAAASGTAQAAEISLPVFEAMALKYGPKAARVFAKFGIKNGMRLIPGVGVAVTAYDVYDIAKPAVHDMYNRLFATQPTEGVNEVADPRDKKVDALAVPDYYLLDKLEKRRHDKEKLSDIASKQQEASASTSSMPDPDDLEPDEKDKFKQHESGRYECAKAESPEWNKAQPFKSEFRYNGLSGKKREYYRWDHLHKDIEVYNSDACYIGSKDPVTGKIYRKGNMVTNRKLESITK